MIKGHLTQLVIVDCNLNPVWRVRQAKAAQLERLQALLNHLQEQEYTYVGYLKQLLVSGTLSTFHLSELCKRMCFAWQVIDGGGVWLLMPHSTLFPSTTAEDLTFCVQKLLTRPEICSLWLYFLYFSYWSSVLFRFVCSVGMQNCHMFEKFCLPRPLALLSQNDNDLWFYHLWRKKIKKNWKSAIKCTYMRGRLLFLMWSSL